MCEKELQHELCGDVDAESGFDINTPQKNDSNILTAKKGYHQLCQKPNQTPNKS